jgi:hypothetical protein
MGRRRSAQKVNENIARLELHSYPAEFQNDAPRPLANRAAKRG